MGVGVKNQSSHLSTRRHVCVCVYLSASLYLYMSRVYVAVHVVTLLSIRFHSEIYFKFPDIPKRSKRNPVIKKTNKSSRQVVIIAQCSFLCRPVPIYLSVSLSLSLSLSLSHCPLSLWHTHCLSVSLSLCVSVSLSPSPLSVFVLR